MEHDYNCKKKRREEKKRQEKTTGKREKNERGSEEYCESLFLFREKRTMQR